MLYGFGVYNAFDGCPLTTGKNSAQREAGMEPPFRMAVTEDGRLIMLDTEKKTFVEMPRKGKLFFRYGAGDIECY